MPVPVLVPLASVIGGRLASWLAWLGVAALVEKITSLGVVPVVYGWIADAAEYYAGLQLNRDDPLSEPSITGAISARLGFPLRTLKDAQMIREDLDAWAAGQVSARSGYLVRSVSNVDILKEDLERVAAAVLSDRLNIPAGVIAADGGVFDPVAIKARLMAWAKAEIMQQVAAEVGTSYEELAAVADVESLAGEINGRLAALNSDQFVTARRLAFNLANSVAMSAIVEYQQVTTGMTKRQRRQEQVRQAQAKFRRRHGNRQVYVPLGFSAEVTENPPAGGG
ncbi:MAG: hypothetical protein E6Q49_06540 [Limnohabitans sp.]|nr:MAG: hypothetical protein E6Q49_06540 [Limnohabitans sp.]